MNIKKVASFALGPILTAIFGILSLPLLAHLFSQADMGRLGMLQIACAFTTLLFSLGLDQAYVREYHEAKSKSALLKQVILLPLLVLGLFASLAFMGVIPVTGLLFGEASKPLLVLTIVAVSSILISRFAQLILRMEERALTFSLSQVAPQVFLLVGGLVLLWSRIPPDTHVLVSLFTAGAFVTCGFLLWSVRRHIRSMPVARFDAEQMLGLLRFGGPLIIGGLAFMGLKITDRIALRFFSTFDEVGLYSVAVSIALGASIFGTVFSTVWAPTVYRWAAENKDLSRVDDVLRSLLAAVLPIFCMTGVGAFLLTFIFPEEYASLRFLLAACVAAPLLYALSETTAVGLGLTRRSGLSMLASMVALVVNLIGNWLLVPRYGAAGAVVSTAVAFWFFLVLRTEFACRVWRPLPRVELYVGSGLCVGIASIMAIAGDSGGVWHETVWGGGFVLCFLYFWKTYRYGFEVLRDYLGKWRKG